MAQQALLVRGDPIDLGGVRARREPRDRLVGDRRVAGERLERRLLLADQLGEQIEHARIHRGIREGAGEHPVGQPDRRVARRHRERGVGIERELVEHRELLGRRQRHEAARRHRPGRTGAERLLRGGRQRGGGQRRAIDHGWFR